MLLRDGVLAGTAMVVAGAAELGSAVRDRTAELGASVSAFEVDPAGDERPFSGDADVIVVDAAWAFSTGHMPVEEAHGARGDAPEGAHVPEMEAARLALDGAWLAIRPVARGAMIERGGGRILLLAPRPGGAGAAAARAGLENLARTLSVEWARFAIRPVAILPGAATSPAEVAELAAFLASPAGEYYSGCAFELGAAER